MLNSPEHNYGSILPNWYRAITVLIFTPEQFEAIHSGFSLFLLAQG